MTTSRAERLGHAGPGASRVAGILLVASAVAGVVMGVVWWLIAPDATGIVVDGRLVSDAERGRLLFDRDARFALVAAGWGLVFGALASRYRRRPVTSLLVAAVGGIGGSLLAMVTGLLLGPDGDVSGVPDGAEHVFALQLEALQALLVWPMVTTVVAGVVALFREDTSPWVVPGPPAE